MTARVAPAAGRLDERVGEACALLERFGATARQALDAVRRRDPDVVQQLGTALAERDALIRRLEPVILELSEARSRIAGLPRLTLEGRRIEALLEPVEQAALRAQVVNGWLERALDDARTGIARELDQMEQGDVAADAYAAAGAATPRRLDLVR